MWREQQLQLSSDQVQCGMILREQIETVEEPGFFLTPSCSIQVLGVRLTTIEGVGHVSLHVVRRGKEAEIERF